MAAVERLDGGYRQERKQATGCEATTVIQMRRHGTWGQGESTGSVAEVVTLWIL